MKPRIRKKGSWWVCFRPWSVYDTPDMWVSDRASGVGRTPIEAYNSWVGSVQDLRLAHGYVPAPLEFV